MFSPSTRRRSSASTSMTAPLRPLSRPVIRITRSPLRIFFIGFPRASPKTLSWAAPKLFCGFAQERKPAPIGRRYAPDWKTASQYLWCQRDDLHELHIAQLARHGSKNTRADGLELVGQQHGGVGVEADQRTIGAAHAALGTHDDRVIHLAFLDLAARDRILDADLDHIAHRRITALRAAEHLDAHQALGAAVVGHIQNRSHLDHVGPLIRRGRVLQRAPAPRIYDATSAGTA